MTPDHTYTRIWSLFDYLVIYISKYSSRYEEYLENYFSYFSMKTFLANIFFSDKYEEHLDDGDFGDLDLDFAE